MLVNSSSRLFPQPTVFEWEQWVQWVQRCFHCAFCVPTWQTGVGTVGTVPPLWPNTRRASGARPADTRPVDTAPARTRPYRHAQGTKSMGQAMSQLAAEGGLLVPSFSRYPIVTGRLRYPPGAVGFQQRPAGQPARDRRVGHGRPRRLHPSNHTSFERPSFFRSTSGWRFGDLRPGHFHQQTEGDAMSDCHSHPLHAVSDRRSVREGWARDYRKRLNALARSLMHDEGKPWPQAVAEATERLQCGAKTRTGAPCRRAGRNPRTGRCEKHGASLGATTPAGRAKLSQIARSLPRGLDGRFLSRSTVHQSN